MKRTINQHELKKYLRTIHSTDERQLFSIKSKKHRDQIINDVFNHFTGYRLRYRHGLKQSKGKDTFDNYRSFNHIGNFEELLFDLKFTRKMAKDKLSKVKRKLHLARKERFEARKRRKVNAITVDVYKLKWQPQNQTSKKRLERLKKIREQERDREFER